MEYNKEYEENFKNIIEIICSVLKIKFTESMYNKIIQNKTKINNEFIFNNQSKSKPKEKGFFDYDSQFTNDEFLKLSNKLKNNIFFTTEKDIFYLIFCDLQFNYLGYQD